MKPPPNTTSETGHRPYFNVRDLSQIAAAGVGAALIDMIVKRSLGLALPGIPFAGSLGAALPRTLLILLAACRTQKTGTIFLLSLVEGSLNFAMGGNFPLAFTSPVGAGLAGEILWMLLGTIKRYPLLRLLGVGAVLAVARLGAASAMALLLGLPLIRWFKAAPHLVIAILLANVLLGGLAGGLARIFLTELQTLGLAEHEKRKPQ